MGTRVGASVLASYAEQTGPGRDELLDGDGAPRTAWDPLGLQDADPAGLRAARAQASRLLEDDGVTYTPPPVPGRETRPVPQRWQLDPLPTVVEAEEWARVERGVSQRVRLLDAVVSDLYGERRLLTAGLVPPELVWRHGGYLRPAWDARSGGQPRGPRRRRVVLAATDLGRGHDGEWQVVADRTQAPSGLGYAMENRRVVARLLPEAYRDAELRRLTGFFGQVRETLADLAPSGVEDPRVVVLTPGRHSETAFDQAYQASLLGFPLVAGADLTVREGRLWSLDVEGHRPVDVVLRRVDDVWCDPLELRPDSALGVPGLLEAWRRGRVALANGFGSGLVESPAFHALLPELCRALLDEEQLLSSAPSWWCGDPIGRSHVLAHLDDLVLRAAGPGRGRGVYGARLGSDQRRAWRARLEADGGAWVGQQVLPLSTTPSLAGAAVVPRRLAMRAFAVAQGTSYAVMPGALGRVLPDASRERVALSKDVWVLQTPGVAAAPEAATPEPVASRRVAVATVPRAMENLFWLGRYAERAEDTTRLAMVLRALADEYPVADLHPGRGAVDVLARALHAVTAGRTDAEDTEDTAAADVGAEEVLADELAALFGDASREGSVAQSLLGLAGAAGSVRDQLSADVFLVLGTLERACAAQAGEQPPAVLDTAAAVLSGTLALAGITSENMVRDVGWELLRIGRGIERALQTAALLRWVLGDVQPPAVEAHLVTAVLTAGESVLTHRRRYAGAPGQQGVETMLDLMLVDAGNPRSVAFQVRRVRRGLDALPGGASASRLTRMTEELALDLARTDVLALAQAHPALPGGAPDGPTDTLFREHRDALVELCDRLEERFSLLAEAVAEEYFRVPEAPRPLGTLPAARGSTSAKAAR